MRTAEIRETFQRFFEGHDHLRVPSASLVPASYDPSVLLTTAGMQPFKPYFRGEQEPPSKRLTSCQKVFRTVDIEVVGTTARHLTFFEMLGNFSVGDYFKQGAVRFALDLAVDGFGVDRDEIWILGFGAPDDRPGDDTERFLEFWNLVFMQYELHGDGSLTPLPQQNIDTGLGLERMAALLQDVPSVFETDGFRPIVELGERMSGRRYGEDDQVDRALRILADHGRGMTMLLSDGVVPSNEDRGYILRRIMRRAIQQGRVLGIDGPLLPALAELVSELMGEAYAALGTERDTIQKWAKAEEEGFGRTLAQGERLLGEVVRRAKEAGSSWVDPEEAFRLHDTYGFPYELTKELLAEQGLAVDDQGFEELMDRARKLARAAGRWTGGTDHERVQEFARRAGTPSRFTGYERLDQDTRLAAVEREEGRLLAKLEESPFYAEGGGQVSDTGIVEAPSGARARVVGVWRLGDDQALALEPDGGGVDGLEPGVPVHAVVDRATRLATQANHTATHLLHAALRERLGTHVRQAGSYVGPDKLRFDFTHAERMSAAEVAAVEERVNEWIADNRPVRAVETTRAEAERLGAMALFGEKYGDWVRMVEIEGVSRELCGGTHLATSGEAGLFHLTHETSSAANVRRVEALTGPAAADVFRTRTEELRAIAQILRVPEREAAAAVQRLSDQVKELGKKGAAGGGGAAARESAQALVARAADVGGVQVVCEVVEAADQKSLLELSDQVKQTLGPAAVVLGTAVDGRVHLVANVAQEAVARGVKAGEVVRAAAQVAGGGGGGRDTMAQAGGRDPAKLPEALAAARVAIERAIG